MVKPLTKIEVRKFTRYVNRESVANVENGVVLGSPKVTENSDI